jgi:DNA helicase II / ATP-dependent DNA helicase PcrA
MELNEQQQAAVSYKGSERNILVTAGAGCGKTRTIIARAAHLFLTGTDAERILIMTFTNRAARELKMRLKNEIGAASENMQAGTFHAFCLKVMTKIPNSFGISGLSVIDSDDQNSLMGLLRKELLASLHASRAGIRKSFPKSSKLLKYYSYSRNTCQEPEKYLGEQTDLEPETITACTELFSRYQKAKDIRGYLDFDDLLERFSRTLTEKPQLRRAVCSLFDEVLVDEMQDTNPIQFEILHHFADEGVRLFCVGDPAQSIYRFRGADFRHVYEFGERFGSSIELPLSRNYRSYQEILDFANWLLSRSSLDYRNPLSASRGLSGYIPAIEEFEHSSEEAAWIADTILERSEADVRLSDIMVLYRTGYDAKPLEAELIRRNIPYRFIGGTILTKSAHVRDVLALLRVVRNSRDDLAWLRYLQLWPRIGERTAEKIFAAVVDAADTIEQQLEKMLGASHPALEAYRLAAASYHEPQDCLKKVTRNLHAILKDRYDNWKQRSKDLELLVRAAANYLNMNDFIDDFTLEPMNDTEISQRSTDDAVTLITVHSAKGTEAPICFVAGADQTSYPHFRSLGDIDAEEEERRILYVALTRAQNELIVTRSSFHRNAFWVQRSPAAGEKYFLESFPEALVKKNLHGWSPISAAGLDHLEDVY